MKSGIFLVDKLFELWIYSILSSYVDPMMSLWYPYKKSCLYLEEEYKNFSSLCRPRELPWQKDVVRCSIHISGKKDSTFIDSSSANKLYTKKFERFNNAFEANAIERHLIWLRSPMSLHISGNYLIDQCNRNFETHGKRAIEKFIARDWRLVLKSETNNTMW